MFRILTITRLFPNSVFPLLGNFILNRLEALSRLGHEVKVVSPIPFLPPFVSYGTYGRWRNIPKMDTIRGIEVHYPRFPAIPRMIRFHGHGYALGIQRTIKRLIGTFNPDLVDVHYLYPDACGAARIIGPHSLPLVCTARGSDVKYFGRIPAIRDQIRKALESVDQVHAVSKDLAENMKSLGLYHGHVKVIRNGVDPEVFHPMSRIRARRKLGLPESGCLAVCVAHLVDEHRQDLLVDALHRKETPKDISLLLIGDGDLQGSLRRKIDHYGLKERVRMVGEVPNRNVPEWLAASNFSVLMSRREGCPNIVLESSACGIPCLLTDLPEMREMVQCGHDGVLVSPNARDLAKAFSYMARNSSGPAVPPKRKPRTWEDVSLNLTSAFANLTSKHETPRSMAYTC